MAWVWRLKTMAELSYALLASKMRKSESRGKNFFHVFLIKTMVSEFWSQCIFCPMSIGTDS